MLRTGRDPFARVTIRKRLAWGTCQWCGGVPEGRCRRLAHFRTWEYYVDGDNPRDNGVLGRTCGIECLRALRGE